MSPCSPSDVSLATPSGASGPAIPGFGVPSILKLPTTSPFPDGFPEDLLSILNSIQFLVPPGVLKPQLNPNFGKDIYDGIMKLLDQFMPFLMLYKFFLPVLNIIICVIEVLCALLNPFALISALNRLFTVCIPEFLNLFPVFAMIIMIISLLLLLLSLVIYLIEQILKLVGALLKNIQALEMAFQNGDSNGVLAIAQKIGSLLCMFQNFFVLLSVFDIIIGVVKDILALAFSIPPCQSSGDSGCCTPNTCPAIVQTSYTRMTGTFKYFNEVDVTGGITVRSEAWQLYDLDQEQAQEFRNIFDAFDITTTPPKPIFFPTDASYSAQTAPAQATYTMDLRLYYNPINWGRPGTARFIRFTDCIMTAVPSVKLKEADNSTRTVNNAVALLVGGLGYEDDGTTVLAGFGSDGVSPISDQATLENFIHVQTSSSPFPSIHITDGYTFQQMEYTFKPNAPVLLQKNLISLGCVPAVALNRDFINTAVAGDAAIKAQELANVVFPDPAAAQQCMTAAISALRSNLTTDGVAQFQSTTNLCLQKLQDDTSTALASVIGIGFDPCNSTFTLSPVVQFTSKPIIVTVSLNEKNGISLTNGLSESIASGLADKIKGHATFGDVGRFSYDGYQFFTAELTSDKSGDGQMMVSFDNNTFCTNIIPTDGITPPSHILQTQNYKFIFAPGAVPTGEGDTLGRPARDAGDLARDSVNRDGS